MSPEEFANHPLAVYHSAPPSRVRTLASVEDVNFDEYRAGNLHDAEDRDATRPMHVGTRRAAMHRAGARGSITAQNMYVFHTKTDPTNTDVSLSDHVLTHKADRAINLLGKKEYKRASRLPSADFEEDAGYYHNMVEDPGSASALVLNPHADLTSHHDAVDRAVKAGKANEVHPLTMHLYKSGALATPESIDSRHARRVEGAANLDLAGQEGEHVRDAHDALASHQSAGTQRAWAFGGNLNVGLSRGSRLGPGGGSSVLPKERDPRVDDDFANLSRHEREAAAEATQHNNVYENTEYTRMKSDPDIRERRGPDLDRIRHFYRAGGFSQ